MARPRNRIKVKCAWCNKEFSLKASDATKRRKVSKDGKLYHNRQCAALAAQARRKKEKEEQQDVNDS
jgi:hypothetical protein